MNHLFRYAVASTFLASAVCWAQVNYTNLCEDYKTKKYDAERAEGATIFHLAIRLNLAMAIKIPNESTEQPSDVKDKIFSVFDDSAQRSDLAKLLVVFKESKNPDDLIADCSYVTFFGSKRLIVNYYDLPDLEKLKRQLKTAAAEPIPPKTSHSPSIKNKAPSSTKVPEKKKGSSVATTPPSTTHQNIQREVLGACRLVYGAYCVNWKWPRLEDCLVRDTPTMSNGSSGSLDPFMLAYLKEEAYQVVDIKFDDEVAKISPKKYGVDQPWQACYKRAKESLALKQTKYTYVNNRNKWTAVTFSPFTLFYAHWNFSEIGKPSSAKSGIVDVKSNATPSTDDQRKVHRELCIRLNRDGQAIHYVATKSKEDCEKETALDLYLERTYWRLSSETPTSYHWEYADGYMGMGRSDGFVDLDDLGSTYLNLINNIIILD